MSAAVPTPKPDLFDQPDSDPAGKKPKKRLGFGRKNKEPKVPKKAKAPKVKRPRRPMGIATILTLCALLTGGGALALYYYLPQLAPPPVTETPPAPEPTPSPSTALLEREAAVAQKEAELATREEALVEKEQAVDRSLRDIGVTETQTATLSRTAKLYLSMAPYKAAPLMAELDNGTAIQILRLMTADEAAAILSAMETDRAARLMRELATPPTNPIGQ